MKIFRAFRFHVGQLVVQEVECS